MVLKLSIYLSCLLSISNALANENLKSLSQSERWEQLLHYRSSTFDVPRSEISSSDFFLSPVGATDLTAELYATVEAMRLPVGDDLDRHAQCQFPARLIWLKKVVPEMAMSWPHIECPKYLRFSHRGEIESISFLFATGYLSNPASYFGHPLIKFNLPKKKIPTNLLDVSVNFGAVTPADENSLIYAMKGLFGGYDATFTHQKFHYNNHSYGELELRDMWEYKLNLNPEEVEYLYSHVWEVVGKRFPYYFLSQNCATAAAQILEDAVGIKMMSKYLPYSLPYTFFDKVADAKRSNGESLVASVKLIPSRQSRLTAHFRNLNENQKLVVRKIANGAASVEDLQSLPIEERVSTVETLLDYYSFKSLFDHNAGPVDEIDANSKRELLIERLHLPASTSADSTNYELRSPLEGPRPFLLRLGSVHSRHFNDGFEFQFRTASYDFLSLDFGRPKNSEVKVMDTTFVAFDKDLWLKKLELISVTTLNLSQTGLPGDGGWAWRFSTGFEKLSLYCRDCDLFKVEAGFGKGIQWQERLTMYSMLDLRGQTPTLGSGQLAATPTAGALINWFRSGLLTTEVSLGYRSYLEKNDANYETFKIDNRLGLSREWDLRASYEKQVDEWYHFAVSLYL